MRFHPALALLVLVPLATAAELPQNHAYQRTLRTFLATLPESAFEHGVTNRLPVPPLNPDPEYQYRTHLATLILQPHVGGKRGIPAINAPAHNFLLATIEGTNAYIVPPVWAESLAAFVRWDSPGNLFFNNKALKMRAFTTAAVKLILVDDYLETPTNTAHRRADWNGYHLIGAGAPYPVFKDQLPAPVQAAYEAGLLSLAGKILDMGPKGDWCEHDLGAAVGLWYAAHATGDADLLEKARAYAQTLCEDPRFFHSAGYWTDRGGIDAGFNGIPLFWTTWLALASDWPFARSAVEKAYRLRAHLALPEPDGTFTGPAGFNNRLGSPAHEDQWHWEGVRNAGAAMLTDEAAGAVNIPETTSLTNAMDRRTATINGMLYGNLRNDPYVHPSGERYVGGERTTGRYLENHEIRGRPWAWRMFPNGWNFAIGLNPAFDFYRPGAYARLAALQQKDSPLLQSPFLRNETFIRNFGDAFIVARQPAFAAILHTGPVGVQIPSDENEAFPSPLGFGGGQLAAFWTPTGGSLLLTRRRGIMGDKRADSLTEWRTWPIHAVSGITPDGKVFSSARIQQPEFAATTLQPDKALITVSGPIPPGIVGQPGGRPGPILYTRAFEITPAGVAVTTTLAGDGLAPLAELFESIPVFHDSTKSAKNTEPRAATIEFLTGADWTPATEQPAAAVRAIRVSRREGAIRITFDAPQRVQLAPAEWRDGYLSQARCRNILIDRLAALPEKTDAPREHVLRYVIAPVTR